MAVNSNVKQVFNAYIRDYATKLGKKVADLDSTELETLVAEYLKSESYSYDAFHQVLSASNLKNGALSIDQRIVLKKLDYQKIAIDNGADQATIAYAEFAKNIGDMAIEQIKNEREVSDGKVQLLSAQNSFAESQKNAIIQINELSNKLDAKQAELEAKQFELNGENDRLIAWAEELESVRRELQEFHDLQQTESAALIQRQKELEAQEKKFHEAQAEFQKEQTELQKQQADFDATVARYNETVNEFNSAVQQFDADRKAFEAGQTESQRQAQSKLAGVIAGFNDLQAQYNELEAKHEKNVEYTQELQKFKDQYEPDMKKLKKQKTGWKVGTIALGTLLAASLAINAGKGIALGDRNDKIAAKDTTISEQTQIIEGLNSTIAELNLKLTQKDVDLNNLKEIIAGYEASDGEYIAGAVEFFKNALSCGYITEEDFAGFVTGNEEVGYTVNPELFDVEEGQLWSLLVDSYNNEAKLDLIEDGLGTTINLLGMVDESGETITIEDYTYQNHVVNGYTYETYIDTTKIVEDVNTAVNGAIDQLLDAANVGDVVEYSESVHTLKSATDAIVKTVGDIADSYNEIVEDNEELQQNLEATLERATTAEAERDQAVADKETAETERDQAVADKEAAEAEKDKVIQENEALKDAINSNISGGVTEDQETGSGNTGAGNVGDTSSEEDADLTIEGESGGVNNTGDGSSSGGKKPSGSTSESESQR